MDLEGPEIWKSHGTHPLPRSRDSGRFRLSLPGLSHLPAQRRRLLPEAVLSLLRPRADQQMGFGCCCRSIQ